MKYSSTFPDNPDCKHTVTVFTVFIVFMFVGVRAFSQGTGRNERLLGVSESQRCAACKTYLLTKTGHSMSTIHISFLNVTILQIHAKSWFCNQRKLVFGGDSWLRVRTSKVSCKHAKNAKTKSELNRKSHHASSTQGSLNPKAWNSTELAVSGYLPPNSTVCSKTSKRSCDIQIERESSRAEGAEAFFVSKHGGLQEGPLLFQSSVFFHDC